MTRFAARRKDWPYDVIPPEGYRVCFRCPVFIPISANKVLCHGCADTIIFPDPDTERAVRLGMSWPGSIEDDIAAMPADRAFEIKEGTR